MHDARVGDHHALGQSGGSRREQNVRHVAVAVIRCRCRRRTGGEIVQAESRSCVGLGRGRVVQPSDHRPLLERRCRQRIPQHGAYWPRRQYAAAVADLEHPRLPRRRTGWIHRHVDRVGLQRAEHGHDRSGHLRHQKTDPISSPAPRVLQQMGEPVARFLECPVRQPSVFEYQRDGIRARFSLRCHPVLQKSGHHAGQRATARSNTTPVCRMSSAFAGASRMNVR